MQRSDTIQLQRDSAPSKQPFITRVSAHVYKRRTWPYEDAEGFTASSYKRRGGADGADGACAP